MLLQLVLALSALGAMLMLSWELTVLSLALLPVFVWLAHQVGRARRNPTDLIQHKPLARYARNKRFADALSQQAFTALTASPGARAYHDSLRARGISHNDALRRLSNRLVGILHGCLRRGCLYDEVTVWSTLKQDQQEAV